jgi:diguanylate cyclase (GGDEF)-like protein/PAS domain S-box-containing protein
VDEVEAEVELFSASRGDGHLGHVNESFAGLLGLEPSEVDGRSVLELVHPEDLARIVAGLAEIEGGANEALLDCRFVQRGGDGVRLQWVARPVPGTDMWTAAGKDTAEFGRLLTEQRDLQTRLDLALGHATATMWDLDVDSGRFTWEPQAVEVLGVPAESIPATAVELAAIAHPDDAEGVLAALRQLIDTGATETALRVGQDADLRHLSLRGRILDHDEQRLPRRAVGLVLDVTTEKAMEEQMLRMVMTDALTGVPNRRAFDRALRSEWRRGTRAMWPMSIVMVDIDDFKRFNDTFGHLIGDAALCTVARALTSALHREPDLMARFGGEEFAIILPDTDARGASMVASRLVEAVRAVAIRQAADWGLSVSVGTATWLPDGPPATSDEVVARADDALYAAKAAGKDQAVAYERDLAALAALKADIARGLEAHEFELYYQPIIDLRDGDIAGLEALIRWNRPGEEPLGPYRFIPAAEGSDLICDIGRWVLNEAAGQLVAWAGEGVGAGLRVAVNVSGRHVAGTAIVDDVTDALAASGLTPDRLELELTETTLTDTPQVGEHLAAVRAMGVTVAIDDFGTGYTSIGQLPSLPADTLKIDRSFIGTAGAGQWELVTLITAAAHACDLRVVGEGVEDVETLRILRDLGCDTAQGFLMARPMPAHLVAAWLTDWHAETRDALLGGHVAA